MSAQRRIFDPGPGTANLTAKEQIVFDYVQASGKRAFDIGRHLHMTQPNPCWFCAEDRTCQYAARDGNAILASLRGHSDDPDARRLVTRRADGKWYSLVRASETADTGTFPPNY